MTVADRFIVQEMLFSADLGEEPRTGLLCPNCGHVSDDFTAWLVAHARERMGCGRCGMLLEIPSLEP